MLDVFVSTLLVLLGVYLWRGALKARERARALGAELCARARLQLLDQTVALQHLALARGNDGGWHLRRRYRFEVSSDGCDRLHGSLDLLQDRLVDYQLPGTVGPSADATETTNVVPLHPIRRAPRAH
jgi:hypothetical protein